MEKTQLNIRIAKKKDIETLKSFEQEVIRYERPFAPNLKDDPISYYDLMNQIERDDAQVLVAELDGIIVASGYALIRDSKPYLKEAKHAYLGFMYVDPKYRGRGINGELVDCLFDWAKSKNLNEIHLEVYAENESAIKAYAKKGFTPDLLKMRINFGGA